MEVIGVVALVLDTEASAFLKVPIAVLSPHADDAVLSCGGLLLQHEDALVLTVCSAAPTQSRPGNLSSMASVSTRMAEDRKAIQKLGCDYKKMDALDAVDRYSEGKAIYGSVSELFGAVSPADTELYEKLVVDTAIAIGKRVVLCPMAVGAHVDHQICAHVGRRLQKDGHEVWFYPDAPYCYPDAGPKIVADTALLASRRLRARIWSNRAVAINPRGKADLVAEYRSQVAELFGDLLSYEYLAEGYFNHIGGPIELYHQLRW